MLYSFSGNIGFAHYPKTAGNSLGEWFRSCFPDASLVEPLGHYNISHLAVRPSLERLGLMRETPVTPSDHLRRHIKNITGYLGYRRGDRRSTRIIGVVREPFDMLVSLYEFCRAYPFKIPLDSFIMSARDGDFAKFIHMAVIDQCLPSYEKFFDVNGPAWSSTRLLDFGNINSGLTIVCQEFGINAPDQLPFRNVGPLPHRDLASYKHIAGSLTNAVEGYFHWYYDQAVRIMVPTTSNDS